MTQGERIAALETSVKALVEQQEKMNQKLDDLISLKNKGVGAFWLASLIGITGLLSIVTNIIHWVRSA